jgi:two-component system CheB/CheR fusion protein
MTIVRDLLDISRIQSGKLVLNKGEYLFSESLMECITDLRKQRPEVMIEVNEIPPLKLNADRIRVEQVMVNLLSNAVKYSPFEKKIKIMAAVADQMLRVSVTDEGIGIPAEKQAIIFHHFARAHESLQHYSGFGSGLFLSAEIVRQHGGDIGVISTEGQGATFWFTLPIHEIVTS